jgi:hypothetical protein
MNDHGWSKGNEIINNLFVIEQASGCRWYWLWKAGKGPINHTLLCSSLLDSHRMNRLLTEHVRDRYNTDIIEALFSMSGFLMFS